AGRVLIVAATSGRAGFNPMGDRCARGPTTVMADAVGDRQELPLCRPHRPLSRAIPRGRTGFSDGLSMFEGESTWISHRLRGVAHVSSPLPDLPSQRQGPLWGA